MATDPKATMKLIDTHHDRWHLVSGEDGAPININPAANCLLTIAQWHSARAHWPLAADEKPVAVMLDNTFDVEQLAPDLPRITMIALSFPKWVDGRAYSQARLLRTRHRFQGEIRATGEVLVDMLPLLERTGFDAAVLRADQSSAAAQRALSFFTGPGAHYQGDVRDNRPLFARSAPAVQPAVQPAAQPSTADEASAESTAPGVQG